MRLFVLLVAIVNFLLSLGFALYGVSIIAQSAIMDPLLMAVFMWAVLSGFCNVCVVYWVAEEGPTGAGDSDASWRLEKRMKAVEKKLGIDVGLSNLQGTREERVEPVRAAELTIWEHELVEKLRKKGFSYPEKALDGYIRGKMTSGKTREQAIKEIDEEYS